MADQNTNIFSKEAQNCGIELYSGGQKGHVIIVDYPLFATFHLFLTMHLSAVQAVMQRIHATF